MAAAMHNVGLGTALSVLLGTAFGAASARKNGKYLN